MSPSSFVPELFRHPPLWFFAALAIVVVTLLALTGFDPVGLPFQPDALYSDAATSHWPSALFLRRSVLEDHAFPLWRPLLMGGQPFVANPLNKVWYPLQWLVLVLPPALHLNVLGPLHLIVAATGVWVWGRATGLHAAGATLAGLAYALAPRLVAAWGAGHLDLVYAAAWFPWVLWTVWRCTRADARRRDAVALGLAAALCFLADVRLSAYVFVMAAAYGAALVVRSGVVHDRAAFSRLGMRVFGAGLLAAGLCAPQWVPLVLLRGELSRSDLSLADASFGAIEPAGWAGLIIGDHGGGPDALTYAGVSVLVLAGLALALQPRRLGLWGVALLVAALYAMGDQSPFWSALNRAFPALRWWRVPGRAWLVAALVLPYLAGWGAQLAVERLSTGRAIRLMLAALAGGGLACAATSAIALVPPLDAGAVVGVLALPATAVALALALSRQIGKSTALALFATIVIIDLLWIDRTLLEWRGEDRWLEPHAPLAAYLRDDDAIRVYSPSYSLPQQAAAYWEIAQYGGVDPFQREMFVAASERATGVPVEGYSVTVPALSVEDGARVSEANREASPNARLLGQWLVTHVVAEYPLAVDGLTLAARIGSSYVYRNTAAPSAALDWHGPNQAAVALRDDIEGPLYAVAASGLGGMGEATDLGLPGAVKPGLRNWTFEAEPDEIVRGVAALAMCLLLATVTLWGASRAAR